MGTGLFVAVVGPSGAGKDTVISGARARLSDADIVFARRVITRPADGSEAHDSVTPAMFRAMAAEGAFLLWWEANGHAYGLRTELAGHLAEGRSVVANLSRGVVAEARRRLLRTAVIHVTASPETIARRLAARGREDAEAQAARLARSALSERSFEADVRILNDTTPAAAVEQFVAALHRLAAVPQPAGAG